MTNTKNEDVKEEEVVVEEAVEPEKIKIGEEEYTQDDLSQLVGLGKIAKEAEEKFNVKVDGIWPKFQQTINENVQYRKAEEERKKSEEDSSLQTKVQTGEELSEEEQLKLAAVKLREMGFVSADEIDKRVAAVLEGKEMLQHVRGLVDEQAKEGNPKTTEEELLTYMNENGIRKPEIAYKLMFEKELDEIKHEKMGTLKKDQFVTDGSQSAGSKIPQAKPITRANLTEALNEALNRE